MTEIETLAQIAQKNAAWVWIAWVGGFIHYLYKVTKWEDFSFPRLLINVIIAWWIGYLCQELNLTPVWISIAWFSAYPLLNLLETKGAKIVLELLTKKP